MIDANTQFEASAEGLSGRAPAGTPSAVAVGRSTGDVGIVPTARVATRRAHILLLWFRRLQQRANLGRAGGWSCRSRQRRCSSSAWTMLAI